jgi:hypothetical protein
MFPWAQRGKEPASWLLMAQDSRGKKGLRIML